MATKTWSTSFSSISDLNYFGRETYGSGGDVTIEGGAMKIISNILDSYGTPILLASTIGMQEFTTISFQAKHTSIASSGRFPNITLHFNDGSWVRIYIYNNFSWSGYSEHLWQTLYYCRGYALTYMSSGEYGSLWTNRSSTIMNNFFNINITLSGMKLSITCPGTTTTYDDISSFYNNKKIVRVDFGIVKHWFNNGVAGYVDNLSITGEDGSTAYANVNGVWKPCQQSTRVNGVWKNATGYANINGVWKNTIT